MTPDALRVALDVSCEIRMNHQSPFSWQAQYLVKLECHFSWQAAFCEILGDSRSAKCCIFHTTCVCKMRRVRSPKRRVRDDDFMVGLSSEHARIVFILAEAIQGFSADILNSEFRGRRSVW